MIEPGHRVQTRSHLPKNPCQITFLSHLEIPVFRTPRKTNQAKAIQMKKSMKVKPNQNLNQSANLAIVSIFIVRSARSHFSSNLLSTNICDLVRKSTRKSFTKKDMTRIPKGWTIPTWKGDIARRTCSSTAASAKSASKMKHLSKVIVANFILNEVESYFIAANATKLLSAKSNIRTTSRPTGSGPRQIPIFRLNLISFVISYILFKAYFSYPYSVIRAEKCFPLVKNLITRNIWLPMNPIQMR